MRAPVESEKDYQERLELERALHAATRENMIRRDINLCTLTQLPYLRPEESV